MFTRVPINAHYAANGKFLINRCIVFRNCCCFPGSGKCLCCLKHWYETSSVIDIRAWPNVTIQCGSRLSTP